MPAVDAPTQPPYQHGSAGGNIGAAAGCDMGVHKTGLADDGGHAAAAQSYHSGRGGAQSGLPRPVHEGGLTSGLPRPVQVGGHTLPSTRSGGRRRLLDYYDFYRTPDNKKVRLGGGNYATVWKGVSRATGEEVAFKIIVKNDMTVAEANPMHAEILKMVDHKNIIQLKDYFDEEKALCLVLELAAGGDIVERVHSAGVFTEAAAVRYSRQILCALAHCHKRGLVHCDIKVVE